MRSRLVFRLALLTLALLPLSLHAAVHNRIIAPVSASSTVALQGNVHPLALRAQDLGEAPADRALESLTLRFSMTADQQAALIQLLLDQQDPNSPLYHQWLTPEQFAEQFGLSSDDLAKVSSWLTAQGFTVTGAARSATFITFTGSVATAERAFNTSIHSLALDGEQHIANVAEPSLPAVIAAVVNRITGLNDFRLNPRSRARVVQSAVTSQTNPQFTSSLSGDTYIAPGDFYTIYDVNALLTSAINGSGVTIAIMGQTDLSLTDVAAFRAASGLSVNAPTVKLYGTDPGISANDVNEAQLDVEWSGAVAPSATILYVYSKDAFNTSLMQAIDNNLAPIVSISYGDCESGFGSSALNSFNQLFQQANAQGITIVGPGGDSGATDCDYKTTHASGGLAVDFPASSPFVTGVGGTMFNENGNVYFGPTNNSNAGSALSYIPEAVWNETAAGGELSAGGGGSSSYFTKPSWQVGTGVPNDASRDVPDIALDAAYIHDAFLFCASGFCTNGFRNSSGYLDTIGGTSVSAPSFAGMLALIEQKIGARIGNANPTLYSLANSSYYAAVFHDVTVGNNDSPCVTGSPNCASGGSIGYNATIGYDLASGWGSIDAFNLANDWKLVSSSGGGSTTGTAASTTTITSTSSTTTQCGTPTGTSVNLTVTVTGASGTPTGTVQFMVDNVAVGSVVTLSGGAATYTLSTTSLTAGNHTVTASYSGDTTYASSKGTYTLNVLATTADFSFTPCTASVAVTAGGTATGIPFTLTSLNGFVGSVSFSVSTGSSALSASYSFSTSPVTLTNGGTGSTTLTLYAYQSSTGNGVQTPISTASNRVPTGMPSSGTPWYAAGSGAALACMMLLVLPKRRRWSALLAAVLSVVALGAIGCGSGGSVVSAPTVSNAAPGTYNLTVTAAGTTSTGAKLVHNATVTLTVN